MTRQEIEKQQKLSEHATFKEAEAYLWQNVDHDRVCRFSKREPRRVDGG